MSEQARGCERVVVSARVAHRPELLRLPGGKTVCLLRLMAPAS